MTTRFYVRMARLVLAVGVVALVGGQTARAQEEYPAKFQYKCLADKQKTAGKYCLGVLKAWSKWDKLQDDTKRDDAIAKAAGKLDGLVISNTSRLGVIGLAKSMASELAAEGILVNVVCPGFTRTERLEEFPQPGSGLVRK